MNKLVMVVGLLAVGAAAGPVGEADGCRLMVCAHDEALDEGQRGP